MGNLLLIVFTELNKWEFSEENLLDDISFSFNIILIVLYLFII